MVADQDPVGSGPFCLIRIFLNTKLDSILDPDPTPVKKKFSGSEPHKFYLVKLGSGLKRTAPATLLQRRQVSFKLSQMFSKHKELP